MAQKAFGGFVGIGGTGVVGFLIATLQGGNRADLFMWGTIISGVVAAVGIGGFLLAKDSEAAVRQSSTGDQSPNISTRGEHSPVSVNINPPPRTHLHWLDRPGGPQFRLEPGIERRGTAPQLLCEVYITDASPMPGGLQARWVHPGIEMDWTTPKPANTAMRGARKFQMKPVVAELSAPADSVTFEVQFYLEDGVHGGRWTWPVRQHNDLGAWTVDSHLGSGVYEPRREDTW